jgi:hypothetical protein
MLVPADRFHGRVQEVLHSIAVHLDPDEGKAHTGVNVARSIFNVELCASGEVKVSLFGQTIKVVSMKSDERRTVS